MADFVELTVSSGAKPPSPLRLIATLGIAGMLSGLVLATAYELTDPLIQANRQRRLRQGVFEVVPGSSVMQKLVVRDGALVVVPEETPSTEPAIYAAYAEPGTFMGYAIVGEGAGFQDTIRLLYGFDPAGRRVIGMRILESRETPGLGDKIYKDADFVANFEALAVDPEILVVTDGRDAEHEVDAITGATISSKAVVRIINESNANWLNVIPPPGDEPRLAPVAEAESVAPREDEP